MTVIIKNGTIVTMDTQHSIVQKDILCRNGVIEKIEKNIQLPKQEQAIVVDAEGCWVIPGLVQTHIHSCQTLARGQADNLPLLPWLTQVIWPYEARLTKETLFASACLSFTELLLGGTTSVQDMATVHHTGAVFEAAKLLGIRASIGNSLVDQSTEDSPEGFVQSAENCLREAGTLCDRWHGTQNGRLRYVYSPRFVLSCSKQLLKDTVSEARNRGVRLHTHASENAQELAVVVKKTGLRNIEYLHSVEMTGPDVGIAHCVWLSDTEYQLLRDTGTHVLHCPSSNLKLGSGIANVEAMMKKGISVSIGADGAPCNNSLDGFLEMRLASLLQKPQHGPKAMPAQRTLWMATQGGANALGLGDITGSIEVGKQADIAVVEQGLHSLPCTDPYSSLVYATKSTDVRSVVVAGELVVKDKILMTYNTEELCSSLPSYASIVNQTAVKH